VLLFAVAQVVTTQAPELLGLAATVQSRVQPVQHALVPVGYAFAIWGLIYLGAAIFALWQALPRNLANPLARRIGWAAAGMYAVNTAWQVWVPVFGVDWGSFVLLATELALGLVALSRVRDLAPTPTERAVALVPLGILTGWVSAATFVNLASSNIEAGAVLFETRDPAVSLALLVVTIAFCAFAVNATRSWAQAAACIWALHGIAVANLLREPQPVLAAVALGGIAAVALARAARRLGTRANRRQPSAA